MLGSPEGTRPRVQRLTELRRFSSRSGAGPAAGAGPARKKQPRSPLAPGVNCSASVPGNRRHKQQLHLVTAASLPLSPDTSRRIHPLPGQEQIPTSRARPWVTPRPGQRVRTPEQRFVLDVRFRPTHLQTVHNHTSTLPSKTFVYKLNFKQTLKQLRPQPSCL